MRSGGGGATERQQLLGASVQEGIIGEARNRRRESDRQSRFVGINVATNDVLVGENGEGEETKLGTAKAKGRRWLCAIMRGIGIQGNRDGCKRAACDEEEIHDIGNINGDCAEGGRRVWRWRRWKCGWREVGAFALRNASLVSLLLIATATGVLFKKVSLMAAPYPYVLAQLQCLYSAPAFLLVGMIWWTLQAAGRAIGWLPPSKEDAGFTEQIEIAQPFDNGDTDETANLIDPKKKKLMAKTLHQQKSLARATGPRDARYYARMWLMIAAVGACFSAFLLLLRVGNRGDLVSPPVSALLSQMSLPMIMLVSFIFLRTRYRIWQYFSSALVIAGIVVALWPDLVHTKSAGTLWAIVLILASNVPSVFGLILMEHYMKQLPIDMFVLWSGIYAFQFIFGIPLALVIFPANKVPFDEMFPRIQHGLLCMFYREDTPSDGPTDCDSATFWFTSYVLLTMLFCLNITYVIKHCSATLSSLIQTVALPLTNITFTWHLVMGEYTSTLSAYDIAGLVIVVVGMVLYRLTPASSEVSPDDREQQECEKAKEPQSGLDEVTTDDETVGGDNCDQTWRGDSINGERSTEC